MRGISNNYKKFSVAHSDCPNSINHLGLLSGLKDEERDMTLFARMQQRRKMHKITACEKFWKAHGLFHKCLDSAIEIHIHFAILRV